MKKTKQTEFELRLHMWIKSHGHFVSENDIKAFCRQEMARVLLDFGKSVDMMPINRDRMRLVHKIAQFRQEFGIEEKE